MSRLLTRPPSPVPGTSARSTPCSFAIRRTSGELRGRFRGCGAASAGPAAASETAGSAGPEGSPPPAGSSSAPSPSTAREPRGSTRSPAPAIRATTVFTATVSPSGTRISARRPATAAGTSVSTLSVAKSKSGSSRSTASPTATRHLVIVPSVMLSPIWGRITSVGTTRILPADRPPDSAAGGLKPAPEGCSPSPEQDGRSATAAHRPPWPERPVESVLVLSRRDSAEPGAAGIPVEPARSAGARAAR